MLTKKELKPLIKKALTGMGVISQFVLAATLKRNPAIGVYSNLLKQMNAKIGLDLYRVSLPKLNKTMVVGTNYAVKAGVSYFGFSSSYSSSLTQHYTTVTPHRLP